MSTESVKRHLERFGVAGRIVTFPESIHTVELASAALGVPPPLIAKTLAVRVKGKDRVIALVVKGTARLDNAKFKAEFGGKSGFVPNEECQAVTGHPPGGVCPFGLREGVEVYLDKSLQEFPTVYPAAGSIDNCVAATLEEMEKWTGGRWVDVCK